MSSSRAVPAGRSTVYKKGMAIFLFFASSFLLCSFLGSKLLRERERDEERKRKRETEREREREREREKFFSDISLRLRCVWKKCLNKTRALISGILFRQTGRENEMQTGRQLRQTDRHTLMQTDRRIRRLLFFKGRKRNCGGKFREVISLSINDTFFCILRT